MSLSCSMSAAKTAFLRKATLPSRVIARILLEADGKPVEHGELWRTACKAKRSAPHAIPDATIVAADASTVSTTVADASEAAGRADEVIATRRPSRARKSDEPVLRSKTHYKRVLYDMKRLGTLRVRADPLDAADVVAAAAAARGSGGGGGGGGGAAASKAQLERRLQRQQRRFVVELTERGREKYLPELERVVARSTSASSATASASDASDASTQS